MKVSNEMARAFNRAVSSDENIKANGSINWNFVDADVHMKIRPECGQTYIKQFDFLANAYCKANGVS